MSQEQGFRVVPVLGTCRAKNKGSKFQIEQNPGLWTAYVLGPEPSLLRERWPAWYVTLWVVT